MEDACRKFLHEKSNIYTCHVLIGLLQKKVVWIQWFKLRTVSNPLRTKPYAVSHPCMVRSGKGMGDQFVAVSKSRLATATPREVQLKETRAMFCFQKLCRAGAVVTGLIQLLPDPFFLYVRSFVVVLLLSCNVRAQTLTFKARSSWLEPIVVVVLIGLCRDKMSFVFQQRMAEALSGRGTRFRRFCSAWIISIWKTEEPMKF